MPGKRVSPAQEREFWALVANGINPAQAALTVGMSRQWGWRKAKGLGQSKTLIERERLDEEQPEPIPWADLDGGVRDCLRFDGGFSLFCEAFLLRRPTPWREDAAKRVVEALEDRSTRTYIVANEPPGAGKSTLFTHDIPAWLICGGGLCDPIRGRAIRIMLGSFGMSTAIHYVSRLKRLLESPRLYYDKEQQRQAELAFVRAFGRFKPRQSGIPWRETEFIVEQLADIDLTEKEPTVQAASREKGFLGERVDFFSWDDLVTSANVRSRDVRETLAEWFGDEAETRLEPGGVGLLVGQRLGPDDLYRNRLDVSFTDTDNIDKRKYQHIVYPAHDDQSCDGEHRQKDDAGAGCLLDQVRLPWRELSAHLQANPRKYRMLYQQEDVDPAGALIDEAWIDGGVDRDGVAVPGCFDRERAFLEWPKGVTGLIDYVTVDPSAGNFWALEWWAIQPETKVRYLIRGLRSKSFVAGDLLQYDVGGAKLTGAMEDWQELSTKLGHPIKCWVIEGNSAFKHLLQYDHFRTWQRRWRVTVIPHKTGLNKIDQEMGVEALLPPLYRQGLKRIPRKPGDLDSLRFTRAFVKELTTYPEGATTDMVMADWEGEWNMARILMAARPKAPQAADLHLPPYLRRQRFESEYTPRPGALAGTAGAGAG
jgi:hypothetical protein